MTEVRKSALRRFSAPYVPSITHFLNHGTQSPHVLFYRSGDAGFALPPKDLLAIGHFNEHHHKWDSCAGNRDWKPLSNRLQALSETGASLVGYLSYESGFAYEERWHKLRRPKTGYAWRFLEVNCWYEADHHTRTGAIFAAENCEREAIEELKSVIKSWQRSLQNNFSKGAPLSIEAVAALGELTREQYVERVAQILEDISAGRYYELNFTQRFSLQTERSPVSAFTHLFETLCPRRGFYGHFPDEVVGSCSPELFLKKEGKNVYTRPIKGSFISAMAGNERAKLEAEHVMVVDLARNDLGRISNLGWVQVPELKSVSTFGGLSHMESLIAAKTSMQGRQILPLTFPAASITGAPKVEVVTAISEYEASCRGLYTGACGWFFPDGDFDLNVAIRTFVARPGRSSQWLYAMGAGGAIVADSDPEREYQECLQKVSPLAAELLRNE